jgi:hypothetical protein
LLSRFVCGRKNQRNTPDTICQANISSPDFCAVRFPGKNIFLGEKNEKPEFSGKKPACFLIDTP